VLIQIFGIEELNASNTRGIDTVRNVTIGAASAPLAGKVKVYILDESHQLTPAAQQALLKILEDCPLHTYFIFCTTDPEMLIKALRNRCTEFVVKSLRDKQLTLLLNDTTKKLNLKIDEDNNYLINSLGAVPSVITAKKK